jgi:hypothetical protein
VTMDELFSWLDETICMHTKPGLVRLLARRRTSRWMRSRQRAGRGPDVEGAHAGIGSAVAGCLSGTHRHNRLPLHDARLTRYKNHFE